MTIRRFELVEGSSSKFWQVEPRDSELHIAWGKIGTKGQSQVKSFGSPEEAASEGDKLIKKKVKEGYIEKTAVASGDETASSKPAPTSKPAAGAKTAKKPAGDGRLSKIVTLWRKAAKLVLARGSASTYDITSKPGAWEAFVAAIDSGDVPLAAVWKLGQNAMDNVPARLAVDLLAAKPDAFIDVWHVHSLAIVPVLTRLLVEPSAFDALAASGPAPIPSLVEIAKIQAGQAPAGSAPEAIRESIGARWTTSIVLGSVRVNDGRVERVAQGAETTKNLGEVLLGHDGLVAVLAQGYRNVLASRPGDRPHPDDTTLEIAAEELSPEEVCRFQVHYPTLWSISKRWSVDDLVRVALDVKATGGNNSYMVAGTAAILAITRDPSCAPRVQDAIQLDQVAVPPRGVFAALVRTSPEWLRAYFMKNVFGPDTYPSTFSGPIGIALLASLDPAEAERLATEHQENIDFARIRGVDAPTLIRIAERSGPVVKRGLVLPIVAGYEGDAGQAPESIDAMIELDGTYYDSWLVRYVVTLPDARRTALLNREIAAGREAYVRAAFAQNPQVLAALAIAAPAPAPVTPREDRLDTLARELEDGGRDVSGERVAIYLLAEGDDAADAVARILGGSGHVPRSLRPKFEGESMAHALTLDLDECPDVRKALGKVGFRAVSLFVSDLDGHAADAPGNSHAKVVWLTEKDLAAAKAARRNDDDDDDTEETAKSVRLRRVEVPANAFDESAENPFAEILVNASYAGGHPSWMQGEEDAKGFLLQFDQELVPMNLADQGVMYVFADTAFLQSG